MIEIYIYIWYTNYIPIFVQIIHSIDEPAHGLQKRSKKGDSEDGHPRNFQGSKGEKSMFLSKSKQILEQNDQRMTKGVWKLMFSQV